MFSDLTKQYFKTTNSNAHDEMFNCMDNRQVEKFQGDGTKKTHYNGNLFNTVIVDSKPPVLNHQINFRPVSSYAPKQG